MSQQPIVVVGDGNVAGSNLNNVGNRTVQNFFGGASQRDNALTLLESKVAFDALLNSGARYPAPKCHVDTRKAAREVVTNWLCGTGEWAVKGIMWMSGAPGVGKSAIVQTVCESLDTDDGSKSWLTKFSFSIRKVDGSYFFGRGLGDREKASFFPATIAFQLCRSRTSSRDTIKKMIKGQPGIFSETFPSQFRQLLTMTAKKRWSFQRPITIVIDALDECDNEDDQVKLLELIFEAVTTTKARFLIASRPEHQIHTFFQQSHVSQHTYHIRLDEESFSTSLDIELFLRVEFARIRRLRPESCPSLPNGEDWPGNIIIVQIRDDSDSQFMYPRLCIDYIDTPSFSPDQQLRTLVAARPARAFSKLDNLYHLILSRRSPDLLQEGDEAIRQHQEVIMAIVQIIIAWPGGPFSAIQIAYILHEKVDVVQNIIRGPMRSLFKFKANNLDSPITLCHKSLRDYLLDRNRSYEFFIPAGDADTLFAELLSRKQCSHPSQLSSRELMIGVLTVVMSCPYPTKVPQIASALDVASSLVEGVIFGPAKALFKLDNLDNVTFSTPSFKAFLLDADRSGEYFIPSDKPETFFTQILSNQSPSDPSQLYSREVLMGVLTVVVSCPYPVNVPRIASALNVAPNLVEGVIIGPAKVFFKLDSLDNVTFSIPSFKDFLLDADRAGEYFISSNKQDTLFIQILSRQPPSDPLQLYSREVLMGVLMVVATWQYPMLTAPRIASILDVAPSLVEGVIFGPARALFESHLFGNVTFSIPSFKAFLLDADRAGEYFIPCDKPNPLFIQILSRQPPSDPSQSYSREALMGVLTVLVFWFYRLTVPQIASSLDVDPAIVNRIVFGPAQPLFYFDRNGGITLPLQLKQFLQDADRAGEFYIPHRHPRYRNLNYSTMHAKIKKICFG